VNDVKGGNGWGKRENELEYELEYEYELESTGIGRDEMEFKRGIYCEME
jgi:hypothetical protein